MKSLAIALLLALVGSAPLLFAAEAEQGELVNAEQALKLLQEGNQRFVAGNCQHPHEKPDWRQSLEAGQHPFAVMIGCSDSRVTPELIFDQGLGDLFVIRVAGNVVDTDVTASVEYATEHLGTQLIVVMGHTNCGAVSATVDHLTDAEGEAAEVVSLLFSIEPATFGLPEELSRKERIELAIQRNVQLAVRRLSRVPALHHRITSGEVKIVGAIYDMHTGKVQFLDEKGKQSVQILSFSAQ